MPDNVNDGFSDMIYWLHKDSESLMITSWMNKEPGDEWVKIDRAEYLERKNKIQTGGE